MRPTASRLRDTDVRTCNKQPVCDPFFDTDVSRLTTFASRLRQKITQRRVYDHSSPLQVSVSSVVLTVKMLPKLWISSNRQISTTVSTLTGSSWCFTVKTFSCLWLDDWSRLVRIPRRRCLVQMHFQPQLQSSRWCTRRRYHLGRNNPPSQPRLLLLRGGRARGVARRTPLQATASS